LAHVFMRPSKVSRAVFPASLTVPQLRRILRLHHEGASAREIVRAVGVARSTVQDALKRAEAAKLSWPLPDEVTDEVLEARLFARVGGGVVTGARKRPEPDWGALVRALRRPAVTMVMLWDEYRQTWPDGYGYSRFCELLRAFQQRLSPVMRQHHVAGDKLFVDYSGKRLEISDPLTGEIRMAEIFVAVLGASNYTFAEVTWSQTLPDWIGSHVRLFRHRRVVIGRPADRQQAALHRDRQILVCRLDLRSPPGHAHRPEAFAKKSRSTSNCPILACNFSISASLAAFDA